MSAPIGVPPLLLSAAYVPTSTLELTGGREAICLCGQPFICTTSRGPLKTRGPCCKPKPKIRIPRQRYTADDVLRRISAPGCALIAFDGGVTLFIGKEHYQADTVYAAMRAVDEGEVRS